MEGDSLSHNSREGVELLRSYTKSKEEVFYDKLEHSLAFGEKRFPYGLETRFLNAAGQPYTLGELWFYIDNEGMNRDDYISECNQRKIKHLSSVDSDIVRWIKGESNTDPSETGEPPLKKLKLDSDSSKTKPPSTSSHSTSAMDIEAPPTKKPLEKEEDKPRPSKQHLEGKEKGPTSGPEKNEKGELLQMGFTQEKIMALKVKRSRVKKASVGDQVPSITDTTKTPELTFKDKNNEATKEILQREKPVKTSQSILQTTKKFDRILETVKDHNKKDKPKPEPKKDLKKKPEPAHTRTYDRYSNEFWKGKDLSAIYEIDPHGSFQPEISAPISTMKSPAHRSSQPDPPKPAPPSDAKPRSRPKPDTPFVPIIILPATPTALVSLSNATQFFLHSQYQPPQQNPASKQPFLEIEREPEHSSAPSASAPKAPSPAAKFKFISAVQKMSSGDWDRVVAVVAQGQEWQFKGWPKGWQSPAEIFSKTQGFFFHYDDEKVPETINQWNVKVVPISKFKRHLDRTAVLNFWKLVDQQVSRKLVVSGGGGTHPVKGRPK